MIRVEWTKEIPRKGTKVANVQVAYFGTEEEAMNYLLEQTKKQKWIVITKVIKDGRTDRHDV